MAPSGVKDACGRKCASLQPLQCIVLSHCDADDTALWLNDLDRHPLQTELISQALGHCVQRVFEIALAHQANNVVQHDRLALALLRFPSALALPGGKLAGDESGDQEKQQ